MREVGWAEPLEVGRAATREVAGSAVAGEEARLEGEGLEVEELEAGWAVEAEAVGVVLAEARAVMGLAQEAEEKETAKAVGALLCEPTSWCCVGNRTSERLRNTKSR